MVGYDFQVNSAVQQERSITMSEAVQSKKIKLCSPEKALERCSERASVTIISICRSKYHFGMREIIPESFDKLFLIFFLLSENIRKRLAHSDCSDTAFSFRSSQPVFSAYICEIMLYGDCHFLKVDVIPQRARHSPHRIPL